MNFRRLMYTVIVLCTPIISNAAFAAPVRCTNGYQDSSCTPKLVNAPQTPGACPAAAGWTTAVAAVWQGSQYSSPQCQYQAPPTCAPGYTQISGPDWNGVAWVDLMCQPTLPARPDIPTQCMAQLPSGWTVNGTYSGSASSAVPPAGYQISWYTGSTSLLTDKCGTTYYETILECWSTTSDSLFYKWAYYTTHASGSCGH
ncbi:hypothetical protein C7399_14026 [Paraburkholderia tropica]|uniref:Secreted protein n=1 Tax=Paraburkholderia tropica TaxID=92647 RepID=A0ABX5MEM0_9BURK|nr:hypothetical protein C7400_14026 [Paraburkholderia tropica]PZW70775.1 hypothetical protein C7399_14026 [Paraburkholderia tropica]